MEAETSLVVAEILAKVKARGDAAIFEYNKKFDGIEGAFTGDASGNKTLLVPEALLTGALDELKKNNAPLYEALCYSRELCMRFAQKQKECFTDFEAELSDGIIAGQKTIPVARAGIYIPAGRFPLFSSVIMNTVPAFAAGVPEVIICTPPKLDANILAAASLCGVKRVYAAGGAAAVAAMAFGTESIPPCDIVTGPGNKFVAEAKKQVFGICGIDMIAGPSEVLIIADESANAEAVCADMEAQAEHDSSAVAYLLTDCSSLAQKVESLIGVSNYEIIIVRDLDETVKIANEKAPEHLELALSDAAKIAVAKKALINYGSLFIGHDAAEVLGDYAAGINHTLPTSRNARFTGGLSVRTFLKTVTTLRTHPGSGFTQSLNAASILAEAEGLKAHKKAADMRLA